MANKFTPEETKIVKKLLTPTNAELSDEDLESVVGGALINKDELISLAFDLAPLAAEHPQLTSVMNAFMDKRYGDAFRWIGLIALTDPKLYDECMKVIEPYLTFED